MKGIVFLFIFSLYMFNVYGQQQVNFVNNSDYDIFISYIVTTEKDDVTGDQENIQVFSYTPSGIVIPAGGSYTAEDLVSSPGDYKFPFNGFNEPNQEIDYWFYQGVLISSDDLFDQQGGNQKFYYAKIVVLDPLIADGGNIGQNFGGAQSYISGTYVNYFFSEFQPNPLDPTYVIYNILIL